MSRPAEKADLGPEPSGGMVQPSPRSTSSTWMGKLSAWASAGIRMRLPALHAGSASCWQSSLMVCPPSMKCSKNLLFRYRSPEGSSRRKITRWSKVLWSLKKASRSATEVCFCTRSFSSMSVWWKSSTVSPVKPWDTWSSLLLADTALNCCDSLLSASNPFKWENLKA